MWFQTLLLLASTAAKSNGDECVSLLDGEALSYLATKRPYSYNPLPDERYTPEGCTAKKLWFFGRHGTRYPGDDDIILMQTVLPALHDEISQSLNDSMLCDPSKSYFVSWKPNRELNVSTESYLTEQGVYELKSIASRFVSRYPDLFREVVAKSSYYFRYTDSQRTNASARAFASSVFDNVESVQFPLPIKNDPLIKFYSLCNKWIEEVDDNPVGSKEFEEFKTSREMNATISNVSMVLGLKRNLNVDELVLIYTTCAFETAWANGTLSPWCVGFRLNDLQVLAYHEDLEYYWKDGYGFSINWEQACVPFKQAVDFFDGDDKNTTFTGLFSHSGATLKMLARLGLYSGDEIRADNYAQVGATYKWRTSLIDHMATNMAFVQFQCEGSEDLISLFVQEQPTPFKACNFNDTCPYSTFRQGMAEFTDTCDFDQICERT